MVGLDVRESSNWGSLRSVWDDAFADELEDLNITATSEGLLVQTLVDGEVKDATWLSWEYLQGLTKK